MTTPVLVRIHLYCVELYFYEIYLFIFDPTIKSLTSPSNTLFTKKEKKKKKKGRSC